MILKIFKIFKILLFFSFFSFFSQAYAIMTELSGNFSYSKQVYGENRQNSQVDRKYDASLAFYLFRYTGIEFDYSYDRTITTENDKIGDTASGITILSKQSIINNKSYGSGLRQAFADPSSFFVPHMAFGVVHETRSGGTTYTIDDNGTQRIFYFPYPKIQSRSVYGTFTLQMKILRGFSIQGSVKTVFPAFKWNKAKDSLFYRAGFSWLF